MTGLCPLLLDSNHTAARQAAASTHKTFALLDTADLAGLMGLLPDRFWPGAKFYCSGYAAAQFFARISATNGGFQVGADGAMSYSGIPIVISPKMVGSGDQTSKVMILFDNLRLATAIGSARPLTFAVSTQRHLEFDMLVWRMSERFNVVCHNVGDNTNAGAMVALVGTA